MVDVAPALGETVSIDALVQTLPGDLSDDGLGVHLRELHRAGALLDAARTAATGVFDARAVWAHDGARSGPGWVAATTGVAHGAAKADQQMARDLRTMPVVEAAFGRGELTRDQVRRLTRARVPELAEAFAACEEILVEQVAAMTVAAGARFLRRWAAEVRHRFGIGEPDGPEPTGDRGGESSIHLSGSLDGRWRLDGTLTGEDGEIIRNVVDAQVDAMWRDGVFSADDGLTASERLAKALVEVLVRGSRGGDPDGTAHPLLIGIIRLDPDGTTRTDEGHDRGDDTTDEVHRGKGHDREADRPSQGRGAPGTPTDDGADDGQSRRGRCRRRAPWEDPEGPTPRDKEVLSDPPLTGQWDEFPNQWDPDLDGCGGEPPPPAVDGPDIGIRSAMPAPQLPGDLFGLAELEHSGLAHPADVGRWLCEGTLHILGIGDDHWDDMRMGRRIRLATRSQRRALRARDGGCVFPGCHTSASYCVAHHVRWWEWGGDTDLDNLVLLCRFHHKAVHDRGFHITRDHGRVEVTRPDGTPITDTKTTRPDPGLPRITPTDREPEGDLPDALLHRLARRRIDALIAESRATRAAEEARAGAGR